MAHPSGGTCPAGRRPRSALALLPTPDGHVPLVFLRDGRLAAAALCHGLGLVTGSADLMVPLGIGWRADHRSDGVLVIHRPDVLTAGRPPAGRVFWSAPVHPAPLWLSAARRLEHLVVFVGDHGLTPGRGLPVLAEDPTADPADEALTCDGGIKDHILAAAGSTTLAAATIHYRPL
jgi:hypothetical protein